MKLADLILDDQVKSMRFTNADGRWEVTKTDWLYPDDSVLVYAKLISDPPLDPEVIKMFRLECDTVNMKDGILTCKATGEEGMEEDYTEWERDFKPTEFSQKFQTEIQIEKRKISYAWIFVGCATFYILFVK